MMVWTGCFSLTIGFMKLYGTIRHDTIYDMIYDMI